VSNDTLDKDELAELCAALPKQRSRENYRFNADIPLRHSLARL